MRFVKKQDDVQPDGLHNQDGYTILELLVVTLIVFILLVLLVWFKTGQP